MVELKAEFGRDLPKNSDKVVVFISKKSNKQIFGCTNTLDYLCEISDSLEKKQICLRSLVEIMEKSLDQMKLKIMT
jgi:hypothetical protein